MGSTAQPQHRLQAWRVCPKARPVPGPLSLAIAGGTRARGVPTRGTGVDQPHLGWLWAPDELGPVPESAGTSAEEAGSSRPWREAGAGGGGHGSWGGAVRRVRRLRLRISSVRPGVWGSRRDNRRIGNRPSPPITSGLRGARRPQSARRCCAGLSTLCPLSWGLSGPCSPSPKQRPPLEPQARAGPGLSGRGLG